MCVCCVCVCVMSVCVALPHSLAHTPTHALSLSLTLSHWLIITNQVTPALGSWNNGLFISAQTAPRTREECVLNAQFSPDLDTCRCFSTCPSPGMQAAQESELLALAAFAANNTLQAAFNTSHVHVSYTFTPLTLLSLDPALASVLADALRAVGGDAAATQRVSDKVKAQLAAFIPSVRIAHPQAGTGIIGGGGANNSSLAIAFDEQSGVLSVTAHVVGPEIAVAALAPSARFSLGDPDAGPHLLARVLWFATAQVAAEHAIAACLASSGAATCSPLTQLEAAIAQDQDAVALVPETLVFAVGSLLSRRVQTLLLQPWSAQPLQQQLCGLLEGIPPIVSCEQVELGVDADAGAARARRRAGKVSLPMVASVRYRRFRQPDCVAGDARDVCTLVEGSARFAELGGVVDAGLAAYDLAGNMPACLSATAGINRNCTRDVALGALQARLLNNRTLPQQTWAGVVEAAFYESIGQCALSCTADGGFADSAAEARVRSVFGTVLGEVQADALAWLATLTTTATATSSDSGTATAMTTTATITTTTTTTGGSPSSSSSSSSGALPSGAVIGIGVASGVCVVATALAIAVVVRRRQHGSSSSSSRGEGGVAFDANGVKGTAAAAGGGGGNRAVLSFENPLYRQREAEANSHADIEGSHMYDEPSVMSSGRGARANPMYESGGEEEEEEHDEVNDEEMGYLDVGAVN